MSIRQRDYIAVALIMLFLTWVAINNEMITLAIGFAFVTLFEAALFILGERVRVWRNDRDYHSRWKISIDS